MASDTRGMDFGHHLDGILERMKADILREHDRELTKTRLQIKALSGRSVEFGALGAVPAANHARKMLIRMRTADLAARKEHSKSSKERPESLAKTDSHSRMTSANLPDDVETFMAVSTEEDGPPPPPVIQAESPRSPITPKNAFSAFSSERTPKPAFQSESSVQFEEDLNHGSSPSKSRQRNGNSPLESSSAQLPGVPDKMTDEEDRERRPSVGSRESRPSRQSVNSTISVLSLPSFFKEQDAQGPTARWRLFLKDADSSRAASFFALGWNVFILCSVFFPLSQATNPPMVSGAAAGLADVAIEGIFLLEFLAGILLEPIKMVAFRDPMNLVDIAAVVPLALRLENGFELPTVDQKAVSHYILVGVVPTVRLLKLIRRFGKLSLVTHALATTGDALKLLLFLLSVIVLCFSTLMYVVEPHENINSLTTAMYICTVTVTTVGYGDVTPTTNSGRVLAGVLSFISVLFMAMPISVLGNAMTHAWADRSRILLMTRTRQRLKNYGYEASDMPSLFRKFDSNGNGELTMDEFCDMIGKMNVGIRPSEAEELFELFDTDASGGIDDKEFMKALFPDDYRRIYMRTTTATMTFT